MKVNLFIVGAAKAGTSSIDATLRECSDFYFSKIKEPSFFCDDIRQQVSVESTRQQAHMSLESILNCDEPTHMFMINNIDDYNRLFSSLGEQKWIGDSSTFYLPSECAAENIFKYNKDARIVIITRDPFSRIKSHYEMDRRIGITTKSLKSLLQEELDLGSEANYSNCRYYLGATDYGAQIKRYKNYFDEEHILIIKFEELISEPSKVMKDLFNFLGLEAKPPSELKKENESRSVRFPVFNSFIYRTGIKSLVLNVVSNYLPNSFKVLLKRAFFKSKKVSYLTDEDISYLNKLIVERALDSND